MSTRIVSWQQLVDDADPYWRRDALNPVVYTFSNGRVFTAPIPLYGALPQAGLLNDGGVLILTGDTSLWPTSPGNLMPGQFFYDNGNVVCIAPNASPPPGAPALFFPGVTSDQLLQAGGALLPMSDPGIVNQLWNNGNVCCISTGVIMPPPPSNAPSLDFSQSQNSQFIPVV